MTTMNDTLAIGTLVKLSDSALRGDRDYWQGLGREPEKSRARHHYEGQCALRGVITEIIPPRGNVRATAYRVEWYPCHLYANGHSSKCIDYMIAPAENS